MIRKFCNSCGHDHWHNEMKELGKARCTYCGHPVSTNIAKRDQQEKVRQVQVNKAEQARKAARV